ncbi:hypothetical protein ABFS82_03G008400 [Erythranthe guttata]
MRMHGGVRECILLIRVLYGSRGIRVNRLFLRVVFGCFCEHEGQNWKVPGFDFDYGFEPRRSEIEGAQRKTLSGCATLVFDTELVRSKWRKTLNTDDEKSNDDEL